MATMLNTVAKEVIKPTSVMTLPFIDGDIEAVTVAIKTEAEAREVLKIVRGF